MDRKQAREFLGRQCKKIEELAPELIPELHKNDKESGESDLYTRLHGILTATVAALEDLAMLDVED